MTAEQKKDFDKAMKEAQKARDYINSSEYKKILADAKKLVRKEEKQQRKHELILILTNTGR